MRGVHTGEGYSFIKSLHAGGSSVLAPIAQTCAPSATKKARFQHTLFTPNDYKFDEPTSGHVGLPSSESHSPFSSGSVSCNRLSVLVLGTRRSARIAQKTVTTSTLLVDSFAHLPTIPNLSSTSSRKRKPPSNELQEPDISMVFPHADHPMANGVTEPFSEFFNLQENILLSKPLGICSICYDEPRNCILIAPPTLAF